MVKFRLLMASAAGFVGLGAITYLISSSWIISAMIVTISAIFCAVYISVASRRYRRTESHFHSLAYYDDLTGLPNRRLFRERLLQTIEFDYSQLIAILYVDIDRFRLINDTLGHDFGDMILMQAAERLVRCTGKNDVVARMEGDEFVMYFPGLKHEEDVQTIVQKIHHVFDESFQLVDHQIHTSVSIGVALSPISGTQPDSLIKFAGVALSKAKEITGSNYQIYSPSMNIRSFERLTMENELRRAITNHEFVLHYQPQMDTIKGQIAGVEALIRWNHPEKGMVPPMKFIPLAEETGSIVEIGEWVLREACSQMKVWHDEGFHDLRVAVNLSSRQFMQQNLVQKVSDILTETGLDAEYLELEITEGVTMDVERSIATLKELTAIGVHISIDDFGTGYSSLNYLKRFPINRLKIDRSFVRDIMEDPNDAAIVSAIISMAHHLKLKVIAEGVETEEQLQYLNAQSCHEIQGYIFSPPVANNVLRTMLDQHMKGIS